MADTWTKHRSDLARLHRDNPRDEQAIARARANMERALNEERIKRAIDRAGNLSPETRDRLAAQLRGSGG